MTRLFLVILGFTLACVSFAAELPKLDELLRGIKSKSEIQGVVKGRYRIDAQNENLWQIYSYDKFRRRPDAILEFKGEQLVRATYLGSADAVSTNRETIEFVETLYDLLEILRQTGDNTASLTLSSFKIRNDVVRKVIELRFKERIISFDIWSEPGDHESVIITVKHPDESFFK